MLNTRIYWSGCLYQQNTRGSQQPILQYGASWNVLSQFNSVDPGCNSSVPGNDNWLVSTHIPMYESVLLPKDKGPTHKHQVSWTNLYTTCELVNDDWDYHCDSCL